MLKIKKLAYFVINGPEKEAAESMNIAIDALQNKEAHFKLHYAGPTSKGNAEHAFFVEESFANTFLERLGQKTTLE